MPLQPEDITPSDSRSINVIVDAIGAYLGKVPAALQKNVVKAFGHLFKVPNAYLDGIAEEIRANSEARVKITKAMGTKIAQSVHVDDALAELATVTHASKILRQQKNAIKILGHAVEDIQSNSPTDTVPPEELSEDWLNTFETEAVNMSSEQMQKLFGKMLAGEIRRPSTFSVRTVKLMGQMDGDVAATFREFCSMVSSVQLAKLVIDGRVITLGIDPILMLSKFGIGYTYLSTLIEYGLVATPDKISFPYDMCVFRVDPDDSVPKAALTYLNEDYVLMPTPHTAGGDFKDFGMNGIALTRVGREILNVVEPQENKEYTDALLQYLRTNGLALYPLSIKSS